VAEAIYPALFRVTMSTNWYGTQFWPKYFV